MQEEDNWYVKKKQRHHDLAIAVRREKQMEVEVKEWKRGKEKGERERETINWLASF